MKPSLLLPLLLAFTASASEFTGKVVSVYDGDTITVLRGKERVRLRISALSPPPHQPLSRRGGRCRVARGVGWRALKILFQ